MTDERVTGRATKSPGLLTPDYTDIKLVPPEARDWWQRLDDGAKARFAERHNKRWTDDETQQLILADPDGEDYYSLAAKMGRSPGALRTRRNYMIYILRDQYDCVEKARRYLSEPKRFHKWADIGQVFAHIQELGWLDLPVSEQFAFARELRQPRKGWRGDNSSKVLRERRQRARAVQAVVANRGKRARGAVGPSG
jgi:hypothetical protein